MLHKTTLLFLALALIAVAFGEDNDGGPGAAKSVVQTGNFTAVEDMTTTTKAKSTATFVKYGIGASLVLLAAL
ncbi:unnamed protein product [Caenorhabditis nigoni]|uniref:Uncharacterized protein n=1 Tax=Caenorhabditis nigoni TaxID=1611254 RepID=A0A2G5ULY6_9PELO|nr:hypothetical protein B9Z55_011661 [Caenorhabditis nigoni]